MDQDVLFYAIINSWENSSYMNHLYIAPLQCLSLIITSLGLPHQAQSYPMNHHRKLYHYHQIHIQYLKLHQSCWQMSPLLNPLHPHMISYLKRSPHRLLLHCRYQTSRTFLPLHVWFNHKVLNHAKIKDQRGRSSLLLATIRQFGICLSCMRTTSYMYIFGHCFLFTACSLHYLSRQTLDFLYFHVAHLTFQWAQEGRGVEMYWVISGLYAL